MDPRYPIGTFSFPPSITPGQRLAFIAEIAEAPAKLRAAVRGLDASQLDTPYRAGGWTVRQVVHHVPDSHINSYIRFKFALTENDPLIKAFDEAAWAKLPDSSAAIDSSLTLLDSLHERWVLLLESLDEPAWRRTFRHPEHGPVRLDQNAALYAWHGKHHVAHITSLRDRMRW